MACKMKFFLTLLLSSVLSPTLSAEISLKPVTDKPTYQQCLDCHRKKTVENIPGKYKPQRIHEEIRLQHGKKEMSCNFCHDKNNHNLLMQSEERADFKSPSGVCAQCHSEEFKSWQQGIHGKRTGGWKGKRLQLHCTECHNAHSVSFPKMKADRPMDRPPLGIPKTHHP